MERTVTDSSVLSRPSPQDLHAKGSNLALLAGFLAYAALIPVLALLSLQTL